MANGNRLLTRTARVHPVFLIGLALMFVTLGVLLGQTLLPMLLVPYGISIVYGAVLWLALSLVTMALGVYRSFYVE